MDREKVIKGLECCLGSNDCDIEPEEDCPYKGMCLCEMALGIDILSLLKEQEKEIYKLQKELNYWQYTPNGQTSAEILCLIRLMLTEKI